MGRRKKTLFGEAAYWNNRSYGFYLQQITEIAISRFKWNNLPETVDERFLEMGLFTNGKMIAIEDEVIGPLILTSMDNGPFDVYGVPIRRRAYSPYNNYQLQVNETDSVICYNNMVRTPSVGICTMFAKRLYNIDRIIDVNVNAQKTPVLIQGNEKQRLSLQNLYQKYDGNEPFIFGDSSLNVNALGVLQTGAPYVSDRLYELKTQIWNEIMTYLGIPNINTQKKERMITDEVLRNMGGVFASRHSYLVMREKFCDEVNDMFGWDISVEFRELDNAVSGDSKDEEVAADESLHD